MRFLAFLLSIVVLLVGFGYFRGWFTVAAAADRDRITADMRSVGAQIGLTDGTAPQAPATAALRSVTGIVRSLDAAARNVGIEIDQRVQIHHIGTTVAITRQGAVVRFEELRLGSTLRLTFDDAAEPTQPTRAEVLP
jgi:hypothetical protein